jgi:hypothetical protein
MPPTQPIPLSSSVQDFQTIAQRFARLSSECLRAAASLVNPNDGYAYQSSEDLDHHRGSKPAKLRPTVTAHLIILLADLGVGFVDGPPSADALTDCTEETLSGIRAVSDSGDPLRLPSYHRLLDILAPVNAPPANRLASMPDANTPKHEWIKYGADVERDGHCEWACRLIRASSHYVKDQPADIPNYGELICIGHTLHAMHALFSRIRDRDDLLRQRLPGLIWLSTRLLWLTRDLDSRVRADGDRRHYLTAFELFQVASGVRAALSIFKGLASDELQVHVKHIENFLASIRVRVATIAERTIDHYLARRMLDQDPDYDPVCLSFALRAHQLSSEPPLSDLLRDVAAQELARSQLRNGCWPDGFGSPRNGRSSAVASQPSAEVALMLASVCFNRSLLIRAKPSSQGVVINVVEALSQFATFAEATRREVIREGGTPVKGWSNDRSRSRSETEMWIPCLMGRAFHLGQLLARSVQRHQVISKYDGVYAASKDRIRGRESLMAVFDRRVQEQDSVVRPVAYIRNHVLAPIGLREDADHYIIKPEKRARSFILFGPPGSGKTHLLTSLSAALSWPVIELNPGNFIRKGVERIEEVAFEVFTDIEGLFHAIVHFDECDGLFADRDQGDKGSRNILSFATAAMLPKLQRLHDRGSVIFVLSTNAVRAIDDAARRQDRFDNILLWDRPDREARRRIILAARTRHSMPEPDDVALGDMALRTGGLPFNDVEAVAFGASENAGGRADYLEWWRRHGFEELKAARFTQEMIAAVEARLRAEVPDADKLRLHPRTPAKKKRPVAGTRRR